MALEIRDRVKETCTGTNGDMTLTGAVSGFVGFDLDDTLDGDQIYYALEDADGTKWEVGLGTLSADSTTLARTTILATQVSFTDTTRQTFSGGTHTIFATYPASKAVYLDASGNLSHTVDISSDTNLVGGTGITLTGDTLSTTDSEIVHDNLSGFVANEHIDWTTDQGSTNIHAGNYTDTNTTYAKADFDLDHLFTLVGASADTDEDLGTFTGSTISDSRTIKQALQDLETELETKTTNTGDITGVTAGTGLTGGGSSGGVTLTVDINGTSDLGSPAVGDELLISDADDSNTVKKADLASIVNLADHDALTNFVANEHVDHSSVSVSAGTGLTGGGTIASTRTLAVDINGTADLASPAVADELLISDADDSNTVKKADLASIVNLADHDQLTNFVANEHIDWTASSAGTIHSSNYTDTNTMGSGFVLEDGDGTEVTITENKEVKFVEGAGIDIDWTDVDNGTDADPYDLTFTVSDTTVAGDSGSTGITPGDTLTIAGGTNATTAMSGDTLTVNVDDAFLKNDADDTTSGKITAAGYAISAVVTESGTSRTLADSDNGKVIVCTNGSATTITVPASLATGFAVTVIQTGAGQITFSASSTTINNRQSHTKTAGQHARVGLVQTSSDTYNLGGDTAS